MSNRYRDDFWNFYVDMGHKKAYYHRYLLGSTRTSRLMDIFTMVTSASSIAGWAIWGQYKTLWAIIIGASQLASVVFPYFPAPKRAATLSIITPMVDNVFNNAKLYWTEIDKHSDEDTLDFLIDLEKQYDRLDAAITTSVDLPHNRRYDRYATKTNQRYFEYRYSVKPKGAKV